MQTLLESNQPSPHLSVVMSHELEGLTGELGFEPEFPTLVSHCSDVGNHCFSGDFFTNRTERHCTDIEPTLPIFLPNSYQDLRFVRRRSLVCVVSNSTAGAISFGAGTERGRVTSAKP
jgi:hypothetical protein